LFTYGTENPTKIKLGFTRTSAQSSAVGILEFTRGFQDLNEKKKVSLEGGYHDGSGGFSERPLFKERLFEKKLKSQIRVMALGFGILGILKIGGKLIGG